MQIEKRKGYSYYTLSSNEWIDVEVEKYGKGKIKTVEVHYGETSLVRYGIEFNMMPSYWNLERFGNMYFTSNELPVVDRQRISYEFRQHLTAYLDIGTV